MDLKCLIITSTILCGFMEVTGNANILVVMPLPARSHFISFQPLWEKLIEEGHNLTFIAVYELKNKFRSNYTFVNLKKVNKKIKIDVAAMRKQNPIHMLISFHNICQELTEEILKDADVQNIINSHTKYDLVIAQLANTDAISALGYKFNAPVIAFFTTTMVSYYNWILGNPFPSTHIPNVLLPFTEKMSLFARTMNMMYNFITVLFYEFVSLPNSQRQIEKYFHFEKENTPFIRDIMKNISVIFVNSHYSFGYPKPDLPNVVNTAGLHLTSPAPLSKNVQKFMDEAEHGVIYLSLGSLIQPKTVENLGIIIINTMENIAQRVVMKWDSNLLPYIPKNFLVQDWLSQDAILNHPKCRLFITHGGLHSALEALNASVPLIGIPFFSDQQNNMAMMEYYKIGITLQADDVSKELLLKSIEEVLQNPKYKTNMIKRSLIFRDRPKKPLETAMYWVDHVLKHKDTDQLRSASTKLTWYELYWLDVFVFLTVTIYVPIILKIIEFAIRKIKNNS